MTNEQLVARIKAGIDEAENMLQLWKKKWYGREPSEREMRDFLGVSAEKLKSIKESLNMGKIRSINESVGDEDGSCLGDFVASDQNLEEDCCRKLDYEIMKKALWETVGELPADQADVIRKRYQEQKTRKELCTMVLTEQRVRKLEEKALRALRHPEKADKFKGYFEEYLSAGPVYHVSVERFNRTWTSSVEAQLGL